MSIDRRPPQHRTPTVSLCVVVLMSSLFVNVSYAAECDTPLPDDVKIIPPSASVPAKLAKFSGRWGPARWDGKLCHNLVVEELTDDGKARAVYSWGVFKDWHVNKPGYRRWTFDIINDKLIYRGKSRIVTYWFVGDELHGTHQIGKIISKIVLKRH